MRLGRLFLFVVTKIYKEQSNDANNHQGILEQVSICYHPGVPPLIKSQGATKRLAPPGVSKYIRGLTTYRFRQCQLYFTRFATVRQDKYLHFVELFAIIKS